MKLSAKKRRTFRQVFILLVAGLLLGPFYTIFSDGFTKLYPFVNAGIAGLLIGVTISILEFWLLAGVARRWKFYSLFAVRILTYFTSITLIISNVIIVSWMNRMDLSYLEVLRNTEFQHYIFVEDFMVVILYALALTVVFVLIMMINRKLGPGELLSIISGSYNQPVIQERIVMFMTVVNSWEYSKQLTPTNFHNFLNDLFFDLAAPIVNYKGVIYSYFEDKVVVTWRMKKGLSNGNCIKSFFQAQEELHMQHSKYLRKYGIKPEVRASIHCGRLVRAEIGDVKTEIILHGDVMNTTSRILGVCQELDCHLLISSPLYRRINMPGDIEYNSVGSTKLKGKSRPMELYRLEKIVEPQTEKNLINEAVGI
jgi:adenylate cyclase